MASEVIMLKFDDTYGAQNAMSAVRALTELDYAWLEDVAIVERHNSGRVSTHTTHGSVAAGAAWGGLTGMLVGLLFPPLGFLALWAGGLAVGAGIEKAAKENGLPKGFLDTVKNELTKGSSALILFGASGDTDEMAKAFDKYHPTSVVREPITDETVESLKKTLDAAPTDASSDALGMTGGEPVVGAQSPTRFRRAAALAALVAYLAAFVALAAVLFRNLGALVLAWLVGIVGAIAVWYVITRVGLLRLVATVVTLAAVVGVAWVLLRDDAVAGLVVAVGLVVAATALATYALGAHRAALARAPTPGVRVPAAQHPVLLMNPKSGGGKAEKLRLAEEATWRGIEPVILQPGDDLQALARDAVGRGADALGAAGGDGTQALIAEVALEHDVPFVCVPAGTRNHFALDLGVDRDDVVGALDAFTDGVERRVDLARVNDRLFVNNVSLGVYARIVQSDEYRDDKLGTVARMLPALLGPDCDPFDLEFDGPSGNTHESADLILVSNNVYNLERIAGFGTRARMDDGALGIVVVEVRNAADLAELVALQTTGGVSRFRGWRQWAAPSFEVRSGVAIEAGVDGEGLQFGSPLRFTTLPGALRVRIASHHPGRSPAAVRPAVGRSTVVRLARLAFSGSAP